MPSSICRRRDDGSNFPNAVLRTVHCARIRDRIGGIEGLLSEIAHPSLEHGLCAELAIELLRQTPKFFDSIELGTVRDVVD